MKSAQRFSLLLFLTYIWCPFAVQAATDKYRCMWRDDPATTMVVAWNQISGQRATLYYDTQNKGKQPQRYTYSQTPNHYTEAKGMHNQFVRLQNLKPNTVYYVLIADSEGCSRQLSFKTAPDQPNERLSIIAGGDSRNFREARRNANIMVSKLRAHVVLFAGDMTGGDSSKEWQQWLNDWQLTIAKDGRMTPVLAARGNHERDNQSVAALFDSPNADIYYGMTFGGGLLRTYTLNSLIPSGGEQKKWLEKDLAAHTEVQWKLAQYHHSMFPHTREKPENWELYKNWAKLFHEQQVNLVVESDAHTVKMTHPLRPSKAIGSDHGFVRDDETGTVYVGEGCWGAPLRASNDAKKWTLASGSFNQFKLVFVDQSSIEVRTIMVDKAKKTASVPMYDPFQLPQNFPIWQEPKGGVLRIANRGNLSANRPEETVQASVPPATSTIRESAPLANKKLYANANGAVNVRYELHTEGEVEMSLLNSKMQRVRRATYLHVNGGIFIEPFQLNGIPKGSYLLILKFKGEVIGKYEVVKR
ncbi:MAG: metallophosphoesterase family protein [Bacteroidota bacterium]